MAVACLCFSASAQAPLDIRVALVIGNSAYANANPLANPANDARAMGDTLRGLGFTVIELRDGQKAQMAEAIAKVGAALKGKQGVGMLYYAGHGLQLDWRNYMVPVDAKLDKAADVPAQTIDVNSVIDAFKVAGNRMNILVLDACRDNPFAGSASGKGLAQVDAPPGTILAYATAPGNVADDGDDKSGNGLYTQFLLQELKKPNARIEEVFKRVRLQVRQKSQGRQIPWESTSLEEEFVFNGAARPAATSDRQRIANFNTELADWDRIKDSTRADDFFAYLQKYPNGFIAEPAQFRLDQLQKARVQATPATSGVQVLASGERRYRVGDVLEQDVVELFTRVAVRRRLEVTFADDKRVEMNGGEEVWDQMGGLIRNDNGTRNPALLLAPAELALGKQWQSAYTNFSTMAGVSVNVVNFRVVALEDIEVPAGRFKAFKIEGKGDGSSRGSTARFTLKIWVDPGTMRVLRQDRYLVNSKEGVMFNDSTLLASYKAAPR